jgi:hypothetical protein
MTIEARRAARTLRVVGVGAVLLAGGVLGACSDDEDSSAGDVEATCALLADITSGEDITDETLGQLDDIIEVAPEEVAASVTTVRDAFAEDGEAAFDDPEVGEAFEAVGAFESKECAD